MEATQSSNAPITVFYSYAHKDKPLRDKLATHLRLLKTQGYIADWSDQDVKPGQEWGKEISNKLESADIILLLVSPHFIATNYCESAEVDIALQRHEAGEAWVIPILLRSVDWETSAIGKLQALPFTLKPVANWSDRDSAFTQISKNIRSLVMDLHDTKNKSNGNNTEEDEPLATVQTVAKPGRRKRRDLYKTIEKIEDYPLGLKIQRKMSIVRRNFSLDAAHRRSKGFSFLLLFLFSVLEVLALPLVVSQLVASSWVVITSFVVSSLLFVMGITGKNNLIANSIVLVYCVTWTLLGYFFLRTIDHIQLTFLSALLGSVLVSCLQLLLFRTRSPRRR